MFRLSTPLSRLALWPALLLCSASALAQGGGQSPPTVIRTIGGSEIDIYGFVRIDVIFDDSRVNSFQAPSLILSEPDGTPSQSNLTIHPRLTRFGMNFTAPETLDTIGEAELTGRIEVDFQNGGRESRAVPRMRHAYLRLDWGPHSLLAGQTSDLISPLFPAVNADSLMWNAGNLGDRRMQIRYEYAQAAGLTLQGGIGLTGAVDPLDADSNGIRDGEAATMPNLQGRIAWSGMNLTVGGWSHFARLHTDATFNGENDFNAYSVGGDVDYQLTPRLSLRGEAWFGSALGDMRGGIGQTFRPLTGMEIDSRGGWAELDVRNGMHDLSVGFTIDDPENAQVPLGGATENRAWHVTNRFTLGPPLALGIDYLYWRTDYRALPKGTDNRVNLYFIYSF
jgi:hypothetical protein